VPSFAILRINNLAGLRDSHRCYHSARSFPIPAIRFEQFCPAARAQARCADLTDRDAISSQLATDRLNQVQFGTSVQVASFREKSAKLNSHLGANFKAAGADAGADRDLQILRPAAKLPTHGFNRFRGNLGDNPTPSSVNRSHSACSGIHNEYRQTVRGSNRDGQARTLGNNGVASAQMSGLGGDQHVIRMNLLCGCQTGGIGPSGAQPGAETVLEPGELLEPLSPVHVGTVKPEQFLL
jgi:hypothetical protein